MFACLSALLFHLQYGVVALTIDIVPRVEWAMLLEVWGSCYGVVLRIFSVDLSRKIGKGSAILQRDYLVQLLNYKVSIASKETESLH